MKKVILFLAVSNVQTHQWCFLDVVLRCFVSGCAFFYPVKCYTLQPIDRFVAGTLVLPLLSVLATAASPVARQLACDVLRQLEEVITSDSKKVRKFYCVCLSHRVRTDPGKPGKYWNLIIIIPGLEYTGISSKVLKNTGIWACFWCDFSTMFIFVMPLSYR